MLNQNLAQIDPCPSSRSAALSSAVLVATDASARGFRWRRPQLWWWRARSFGGGGQSLRWWFFGGGLASRSPWWQLCRPRHRRQTLRVAISAMLRSSRAATAGVPPPTGVPRFPEPPDTGQRRPSAACCQPPADCSRRHHSASPRWFPICRPLPASSRPVPGGNVSHQPPQVPTVPEIPWHPGRRSVASYSTRRQCSRRPRPPATGTAPQPNPGQPVL